MTKFVTVAFLVAVAAGCSTGPSREENSAQQQSMAEKCGCKAVCAKCACAHCGSKAEKCPCGAHTKDGCACACKGGGSTTCLCSHCGTSKGACACPK